MEQERDPHSESNLPADAFAQELQQQHRIFEAALSTSPDFIYVFGLDGRFRFANKALCDLLGRTLQEVVGRTFFELPYPIDLATTLHLQIQSVIDLKQRIRSETPYTAPSGQQGVYEYILSPVLDANGAVEAVSGTTREITERVKERIAVAAQNRDLRDTVGAVQLQTSNCIRCSSRHRTSCACWMAQTMCIP